ncbi:MAG: bifunctional phosphopantothenoylcysteine decarboxylase/phosphopantothenate--cysteine ligase CoaBC [Gammaproteobacteria bacterium]|nr:bifunctional phosphopantothenoylcysteine decarboxylase/phosphopantothenate--cysteine ligase CoaBC [Gammaproteobacteria bacterium]
MNLLAGKRILLGVTAGIAAYKAPDVVRRLRDQGAEVRVVMTHSAAKMVAPTVFQAVSGHPVRLSLWDEQAEAAMGHIELARWADYVVIAPATAHVLAELANGLAGDLLTTLCIVTRAPIVVAPAMNHSMWLSGATQANRARLAGRGVLFVGPGTGSQACGESGPGRLAEPAEIVQVLTDHANAGRSGLLAGLHVLVTAGPTREPIDPVRFLSNRSSGKMGFAVAEAAAAAGARVTLVAGAVSLPTPAAVERIDVESAAQMNDAVMSRAQRTDIYIGAAAVADYRPVSAPSQKIKKNSDSLDLHLVKCPDILAGVAALDNGPFTVGFAAETERLEEYALDKLRRKGLGMIVANLVGDNIGFDRDDNSAMIFWPGGQEDICCMSKADMAAVIIARVADRYRTARSKVTPLPRTRTS